MKKFLFRFTAIAVFSAGLISPVKATEIPVTVPSSSQPAAKPDDKAVAAAMEEFNSLSRRERKSRMHEVKKLLKETKAARQSGKATDDDTVLLAILAILLPPLAVYLKQGQIDSKFWISLILTLLFWLPGVIYALLVVFDVV